MVSVVNFCIFFLQTIPIIGEGKCVSSCNLQILRDIILPQIDRLKNLDELETFEKLYGWRLREWTNDRDGLSTLKDAMPIADESPKECANLTGIDMNCSYKPFSETDILSLEALGWIAVLFFSNKFIPS